MKLLITGASGFIGRYVVANALARGWDVCALVRSRSSAQSLAWTSSPKVMIVEADLLSSDLDPNLFDGISAVIHLAIVTSSTRQIRLEETVAGTERLLKCMEGSKCNRILLVSSFAVYDYLSVSSGSVLNEDSGLEPIPERRHAYAQAKLLQEKAVCGRPSLAWTIVRPGAVWGAQHYWTTRLGKRKGRWWFRLGSSATLPLTYVENCAEALVDAATSEACIRSILNVVDDELPTQREFMARLRKYVDPRPRIIPVPWTLLRVTAEGCEVLNHRVLRGRARMPTTLVPASVHASAKPLRYPNDRIKRLIGWEPRYGLDEALYRCFELEESQLLALKNATGSKGGNVETLVGTGTI